MKGGVLLATLLGPASLWGADRHLGPVTRILVAERQVFSASQSGVMVGTGQNLQRMVQPGFRVNGLALLGAAPGKLLLVAGGKPGEEGLLASIHLKANHQLPPRSFDLGTDLFYGLAASPDGQTLALAAADGSVLLGDLDTLARGEGTVRHRHSAPARTVAFSPNGKWLASVGLDGAVILSPAQAEESDPPRQFLDHTAGVESLVFSPDSLTLASGSRDSKVRLHDVRGNLIRTYPGLGMEEEPVAGRVPARVLSLAWKDQVLVAGTSKGSLYRLSQSDNAATPLPRTGADPIYALAFAPDGTLYLGGHSRLHSLAPPAALPD